MVPPLEQEAVPIVFSLMFVVALRYGAGGKESFVEQLIFRSWLPVLVSV
ncbi:Uncharacterised protein [uncultured archaeon]|nr:Uncharacterised protein [uncultured archaeon]